MIDVKNGTNADLQGVLSSLFDMQESRAGALAYLAAAVQGLKNVEDPSEFMDRESCVGLLDFLADDFEGLVPTVGAETDADARAAR